MFRCLFDKCTVYVCICVGMRVCVCVFVYVCIRVRVRASVRARPCRRACASVFAYGVVCTTVLA